jgi:hypothetical protein
VRPSTATGGPARILIQAIGMRRARLAALPCSSRAISLNGMTCSYHPYLPLWSLSRLAKAQSVQLESAGRIVLCETSLSRARESAQVQPRAVPSERIPL